MAGNGKEKKKDLGPEMFLEFIIKITSMEKLSEPETTSSSSTQTEGGTVQKHFAANQGHVTAGHYLGVSRSDANCCLQVVSPSNVRQRNHDKKC